MKLERWAMVGEIIASIAIVVTLAILIVELRGNTNAIQVATIDNVTGGWIGLNESVVSDPQVARALIVGLYNPDALTDVEAVQFSMWLRMFANQVERVGQHHVGPRVEVSLRHAANDFWMAGVELLGVTTVCETGAILRRESDRLRLRRHRDKR